MLPGKLALFQKTLIIVDKALGKFLKYTAAGKPKIIL